MFNLAPQPGPGWLVEFMQGNQPQLAYVLEDQQGRLRMLTQTRREAKLPATRLLPWPGPATEFTSDRGAIERLLDEHHARRQALLAQVDALELWSLAQGELEQAEARWFAELKFSAPGPDEVAAVGRAILACKSHFKFDPPAFHIYPAEVVEARVAEAEADRVRRAVVETGNAFLKTLWNWPIGAKPPAPSMPDDVARRLAELLRSRIRTPDDQESEALWRELHQGLPDHPFLALVLAERWGLVSQHYNYLLDRVDYAWGDDWNGAFAGEVQALVSAPLDGMTADARAFVSIDAETTRDIDDAFVLEADPEAPGAWRLAIALACPVRGLDLDGPLGRAVQWRATSLYLPEGVSHMLPQALAEDAFSLRAGQPRPALVLDFHVPEGGPAKLRDIALRQVRVAENISYAEAEARLETSDWLPALELATDLRQARIDRGAAIIDKPEPEIVLDGNQPRVRISLKTATPASQLLVSELMILANTAVAEFALAHDIPLLYRSQEANLPPEAAGVWTAPEDIQRVVKFMGPATLGLEPAAHRGLGVPAYSPVSSPIRRLTDLFNAAQLHDFLVLGQPRFTRAELARRLADISGRLDAVGQVQRFRPRYWKLLYYQQNRKSMSFPAVVVDDAGTLATLALPESQIFVRAPRSMLGERAFPGQQVLVRFGRVDPLTNELRVAEVLEADAAPEAE